MPYCFAPGCNHVSRREICRFFRFPANETIFNKWNVLCRRKDRDPTREDRLCSCHFADERDVVPSIFAHNSNKRFEFLDPEKRKSSRTKKKTSAEEDVTAEQETLVQGVSANHPTLCQLNGSSDVVTTAVNYFLQENQKLKEVFAKGERRLSFKNIQTDDLLVFQYTGLPTAAHFLVLVELISRFEINYVMGWKVETINIHDQLLCTLMKLRLNLQYFDLRFKINSTTVQNIFITFRKVLHDILFKGMMDVIPSREKNTFFLPTCFVPFPNNFCF
ncbi:unnamed protein product [Euphydryas editha]|uniref:THAP-type domain-containing protein n=1 Tax=Euphydryas editha TaxID=104508 RepID=A0AAU9UNY1_EUPED|nr:unnamed protein product [Euphydryas editha]